MNQHVAFVFHPAVDREMPGLVAARGALARRGIPSWDLARDLARAGVAPLLKKTALIVSLGGDGTFLAGARLAAPRGIDVLGVNLGRLGFLTELEVGGLAGGLEQYLDGDARIEERSVLEAALVRHDRSIAKALAVNEVVVHRGSDPRVIRLTIHRDQVEVGTFHADGALIATPTGSTAYSLALGGPILEPTLRDMILVPVNPFALTVRPIVFSAATVLRIGLPRFQAELMVDGRRLGTRMLAGDQLAVSEYAKLLRVVRLGPSGGFFQHLRQKMGWGTPLVPQP